ncbi:membrane hypothetical protein [Tenacibaculum dicentrarchi]|uniref:O-antigen ligase-related domain-containing protein n=2 Tax=Tenacibaculum dicentrarchi TaxID=669041 RepID=A0ABP1EES0_9FLAO|nr:membrane hypothetical protein [Tenacibaculum dicentrarchi]SOS52747.1 membrane hypothetical protein [Tenacibaculum dicentrarchi]
MKIDKINFNLLILIFILFPFWQIVTAQINFFLKIPLSVLTSIKYLLVFLSIFLFLFKIYINNKIDIRRNSILLGIYVFYVFCHLIGSGSLFLKMDGFKFEFIFPFLALLIFNSNYSETRNFDILIKILFYQGIITLVVGFLEFFDQNILTFLYRKSLDDIPHINWFSVQRLMSTAGNPINLGATLSIWIVAYLYILNNRGKLLIKIFYPVILLLTFFIVSMTLSRTSLIVFILTAFLSLFLIIEGFFNRVVFVSLISLILLSIIGFLLEGVNIDLVLSRFQNLFEAKEYTSNARVINWNNAFDKMDFIEYIWGKGIGTSTPKAEYVKNYNGVMIENGFISTFINYGIIGLLMYLLLTIRFFYLSIKLKSKNKGLGLFLLLFLVVFCFFNMSNDYNRNLPYMMYFWVFYIVSEIEFEKIKNK